MDLPPQLAKAQENISAAGLADRFNQFPCDMLDPKQALADNADVYWMSQFLDCFSEDEIITILKHAAKSMSANSELFIMETFWDNQDYPAATFSLAATSVYFTAMANGNSKMYGLKRFINLVNKAGLEVVNQDFPIGISHTILTCKLANA